MRSVTALVTCGLVLATAGSAFAGPVAVNSDWYEFYFDGVVGNFAVSGVGVTTPSSGGNSVWADDPPWTFTAGASGALLTVTDAFLYGDAFEIFDNASSIGSTPIVPALGDSGNSDPAIAILDPDMSHATFLLAPGSHSLTIKTIASVGGGAGYFRVDDRMPAVPAPGALALVGTGLLGLFRYRRRATR